MNFIIRGAFKGKTTVLRKCKQWCAMAAASIMVVLPGLNSRRLPNHVLHMFLEKNRLVIILFPITFILKTFLSLLILFQKGPLLFLVFYPSPMSRRLSALLTAERIWFKCDLYLQFIPPINQGVHWNLFTWADCLERSMHSDSDWITLGVPELISTMA